MVTEKLLDFLFLIADKLLGILPEFSYTSTIRRNWSSYLGFWQYVEMGAYLLPLDTIVSIISLVIVISLFRLAVSVIRAVWDLLPFV